jgi:AraC-like DNA-binding protein
MALIVRAIKRLRKEFDQPLQIDAIAQEAGMSVSGFHQHFRALTAMSPLQFQKRLRLQEARRLMLGKGLDATSAGYRVGYADVSHFTREYKRYGDDLATVVSPGLQNDVLSEHMTRQNIDFGLARRLNTMG